LPRGEVAIRPGAHVTLHVCAGCSSLLGAR
jgi:hypothetical protein